MSAFSPERLAPDAALVVAGPAPHGRLTRWWRSRYGRRMLLELVGVLAAFVVYKAVRLAVRGQAGAAYENAARVVRGERALGIFNETRLQHLVLDRPAIVRAANRYYESAHLPVTGLALLWLYVRCADGYLYARRALVVTSAAGMVLHVVFPLAPPRMMTSLGFVDTGSIYGPATYGDHGFLDRVANQIAAMPSLHFGWALILALAIVRYGRSRWRWLTLLHPVATAVVVVVTANHYWSDVIVAGLLVLLAHRVIAVPWRGRGRAVAPAGAPVAGVPTFAQSSAGMASHH